MHLIGNTYSVAVPTILFMALAAFSLYREQHTRLDTTFDYIGFIVVMIGALFAIFSAGWFLVRETMKLLASVVVSTSDEVLLFGAIFAITAVGIAVWEYHDSHDAEKAWTLLMGALGTLFLACFFWFVIDLAIRSYQGR